MNNIKILTNQTQNKLNSKWKPVNRTDSAPKFITISGIKHQLTAEYIHRYSRITIIARRVLGGLALMISLGFLWKQQCVKDLFKVKSQTILFATPVLLSSCFEDNPTPLQTSSKEDYAAQIGSVEGAAKLAARTKALDFRCHCPDSAPCQHHCLATLDDGQQVSTGKKGDDVVQFLLHLRPNAVITGTLCDSIKEAYEFHKKNAGFFKGKLLNEIYNVKMFTALDAGITTAPRQYVCIFTRPDNTNLELTLTADSIRKIMKLLPKKKLTIRAPIEMDE